MQLFGFDYSFALTTDIVNQILAANRSASVSVSSNGTDDSTGFVYSVIADLDTWSIVTGGSNNLLRISCPLTSGTLSVTGESDASLVGFNAILEVSLSWLDNAERVAASGSGSYTTLSLIPGQSTTPGQPSYVSVVSITGPNSLGVIQQALLQTALLQAIIGSKANLSGSLANVNPAAAGTPAWLNPLTWDYFYTDIDQEKGLLCFLCMLSSATAPETPAFDTSAYSASNDATILVSQQMFFLHMLLPAFQASLPNISLSVQQQANCNPMIAASGGFSFGNLAAQTFNITASSIGGSLRMNVGGTGSIGDLFPDATAPNATYTWSGSSCNPLVFNAQTQSLSFAADPNPQSSASNSIPWYDYPLIGACAAASATEIGDQNQTIDKLSSLSTDSLHAISSTVTTALQHNMNGSLVNLAKNIQWNGSIASFTITAAGLEGALYLNANLTLR